MQPARGELAPRDFPPPGRGRAGRGVRPNSLTPQDPPGDGHGHRHPPPCRGRDLRSRAHAGRTTAVQEQEKEGSRRGGEGPRPDAGGKARDTGTCSSTRIAPRKRSIRPSTTCPACSLNARGQKLTDMFAAWNVVTHGTKLPISFLFCSNLSSDPELRQGMTIARASWLKLMRRPLARAMCRLTRLKQVIRLEPRQSDTRAVWPRASDPP